MLADPPTTDALIMDLTDHQRTAILAALIAFPFYFWVVDQPQQAVIGDQAFAASASSAVAEPAALLSDGEAESANAASDLGNARVELNKVALVDATVPPDPPGLVAEATAVSPDEAVAELSEATEPVVEAESEPVVVSEQPVVVNESIETNAASEDATSEEVAQTGSKDSDATIDEIENMVLGALAFLPSGDALGELVDSSGVDKANESAEASSAPVDQQRVDPPTMPDNAATQSAEPSNHPAVPSVGTASPPTESAASPTATSATPAPILEQPAEEETLNPPTETVDPATASAAPPDTSADDAAEEAEPAALPWLGVRMERPVPKIMMVFPGSGAADTEIEVGDTIVGIAGKAVKHPDDVVQELSTHQANETIEVKLLRGDEEFTISTFLGKTKPEATAK